jgi:serine protease Do
MKRGQLADVIGVCLLVCMLGQAVCTASPDQNPQDDSRAIDFQRVIANAKSKVFPALVYVKPIREEFEWGEKQKQEVFGSGVIISPDGYVVTNNHVAEKAIEINCVLYDKRQLSAETVGLDPETDLALLRLLPENENELFPYAEFGDSDALIEGEFVMTLGSPFGFTRSISLGIVSNTRQYIGFKTLYQYNTWVQTDAAINPGNSGGPLVNTDGKVVGINTLGIFFAENMGFSIPSNVVRDIVERLKTAGQVRRSRSGVKLQALKDFYSNTFTEAETGVLIADVEENSPADRAGVRAGDILVAVNGEAVHGEYVEQLPAIRWALSDLPPEVTAELEVQRNGNALRFPVIPQLKGKVEGEDFDCKRWNMTVKEISKYQNPRLHFYKEKGVFIQGVRYPGNARSAGLRRNDILEEIDGREVTTLEEVKELYEEMLADEEREKKTLVEVSRNGYQHWKVLDYRKDYEEED